jgi:dTDP-4-dehydrorhamnose 3,5-epimerase
MAEKIGRAKLMQQFSFEQTVIEGLIKIKPFVADDARGYFVKDYSKELFEKNGIDYHLEEVFYTSSCRGTIRALHFQRIKQQPKLVRCVWGRIFDVVVDLRKDKTTFKKWLGFELSEENKIELLIPAGCAHGYLVLEHSIVSYKCAEQFYGEYDDGILWNDLDIGVQWPLDEVDNQIILSEKDKSLQSFAEFVESSKDATE